MSTLTYFLLYAHVCAYSVHVCMCAYICVGIGVCVHCSMLVGAKGWHKETFPIILYHIHGGIASQLYLALNLAALPSQLVQEISFCIFWALWL